MFILNYRKSIKYLFVFKEFNLQKNLLFKFLESWDRRLHEFSLFSKTQLVYVNLVEFLKKSGLI